MKAFRSSLWVDRGFALLFGLLALRGVPCLGQVTLGQIVNGLVDYYPLNSVVPGTTDVTPDLINRRDMTMHGMTSNNIVVGSHPGIEAGGLVMNFSQSPAATLIYYQTAGQNPLDGSGDFLPFINQRGATMNFWCRLNGAVTSGGELRAMAETDNGGGDNNPFFSISATGGTSPARYFLRGDSFGSAPNGVSCYQLEDGTYELPNPYYIWTQPNEYSTSNVFDNNWHMLTLTIDKNGDVHQFIDGAYDPGVAGTSPAGSQNLDNEGNQAICPPIYVTNVYYTTNNYPLVNPPTNNPPPNGYVHWVLPHLAHTGATVFGGVLRNGGFSAGLPGQISDIGFWNRVLSPDEIRFVMTNGLYLGNVKVTWTGTPSIATTNNVTCVEYSWSLSGCEDLVSTGPLMRNGNTFSYDFDVMNTIAGGCPLIIVYETTTVALGTLAPGVYTLITTSWGAPVMTNTFTVAPVLQPNGFDTNGYFQIQMSSGVTNVNYVLQCSTDFVNWISLSTNAVSTNTVGVPLTDFYPVLSGICFYRVLCQ